jgi:NADPH:quinone reductase-like Zn-dependent oxidoreductase
MECIRLVKNGDAKTAFERQQLSLKNIGSKEVKIKVDCFGLNFADVMARRGLYKDAPPMPSVLGYEAAGIVEEIGNEVTHLKVGDKVLAFTHFGGYATHVISPADGVLLISEKISFETALALATQYVTAYYAAIYCGTMKQNQTVLINSAAGGVGIALVQLAQMLNCKIIATAGSESKIKYLKDLGVHKAINYSELDFKKIIEDEFGANSIDAAYDAVGGETFKKSMKLLNYGGRMVSYGASSRLRESLGFLSLLKTALDFGIYHPVQFIMNSRSLVGVNMLRIAESKPDVLEFCLKEVMRLAEEGHLNPHIHHVYPVSEIANAHHDLESRKTMGKLVVKW